MCSSDFSSKPRVRLSSFLSPKLVAFLNHSSRDEILRDLADLAGRSGVLKDTEDFFQALLRRERIMSTGIGMGIAIPHGRLDQEDAPFFIAIGIHNHGVLWDAVDGSLVRLIFLIGGPHNASAEYLQLLSTLTQVLRIEDVCQRLLSASTIEEVMNVFERL